MSWLGVRDLATRCPKSDFPGKRRREHEWQHRDSQAGQGCPFSTQTFTTWYPNMDPFSFQLLGEQSRSFAGLVLIERI